MKAIMTYHSIDRSGSVISMDPSMFDEHVRFFASGRVKVLSLPDLALGPEQGDAVAITFDDGFANFATEAWPRLRDHGLSATVFAVSERVGADNAWGGRSDPGVPTLPLLDWDQIGRLADEGVAIGSHSRTHPYLNRVDSSALEGEIHGSADDIEQAIGRRPASFCYPYGEFDERAHGLVAATYRYACTTVLSTLRAESDPHRLPRLDAYYFRNPRLLEQWGSMHLRVLVRGRSGLRAIRRTVRNSRRHEATESY
jgi:peptidoglycan/xylan/chitin deacetylase (PgdA/CDA1 family)